MKIDKIDHIGIAVNSLDEAQPFWEQALGLHFLEREYVDDQKVNVAMGEVDRTHIELLEPTDPSSPIAKYLEKNRPGIHHLAITVDDIDATLARLKKEGVRLIDETPRVGAGGKRIAFVHPKSTSGVLLELSEECKS